MLAITRQKKVELSQARLEGNLVKNTPGPLEELHNQTDVPRAVDENIPEVHDLEGPSAGDLEAGNLAGSMAHDGPCDGLSDSDELLDDTDVINVSDLQQFSSALQEAQCLAIQVEIENVKGKQKNSENIPRQLEKNPFLPQEDSPITGLMWFSSYLHLHGHEGEGKSEPRGDS
ncbi:hypothetical protein V8E53_006447 [Lactarius tabidus]